GRCLVFLSGTLRNTRLSVADANGETAPEMPPVLDSGYGPFDLASIGKNQLRLVYTRLNEDSDIWRIPLNHVPVRPGEATKVVESRFLNSTPRVSPDGTRFAFISNRTGNNEIWIASLTSRSHFSSQRSTEGRSEGQPGSRKAHRSTLDCDRW